MTPNDTVLVRTTAPYNEDETYHEPHCSKVSQRNLAQGTYTAVPRRYAAALARPCRRCHPTVKWSVRGHWKVHVDADGRKVYRWQKAYLKGPR